MVLNDNDGYFRYRRDLFTISLKIIVIIQQFILSGGLLNRLILYQ